MRFLLDKERGNSGALPSYFHLHIEKAVIPKMQVMKAKCDEGRLPLLTKTPDKLIKAECNQGLPLF